MTFFLANLGKINQKIKFFPDMVASDLYINIDMDSSLRDRTRCHVTWKTCQTNGLQSSFENLELMADLL